MKKHGETAREGVMLSLFNDLKTLEDVEKGRHSPRWPDFTDQSRTLLIDLFGKDRKIRSSDCPRHPPEALADTVKAYYIEKALVHDRSPTIDRAVVELLRSCADNDPVAKACLGRLVGRGYDAELERHCNRLHELGPLEKLGYTPLHVAVEQERDDLVRALLAKGASPAAQARNGMTPLHLAVTGGCLDLIQLLAGQRQGLDLKDRIGRTAVDLALATDNDQAVRALVKAGCRRHRRPRGRPCRPVRAPSNC